MAVTAVPRQSSRHAPSCRTLRFERRSCCHVKCSGRSIAKEGHLAKYGSGCNLTRPSWPQESTRLQLRCVVRGFAGRVTKGYQPARQSRSRRQYCSEWRAGTIGGLWRSICGAIEGFCEKLPAETAAGCQYCNFGCSTLLGHLVSNEDGEKIRAIWKC